METASQPRPVPVTILTGFLGAGKTTLLNHILSADHGKRIAVLVNDFGKVNIDASLIKHREEDVLSLANGCICCNLSDGLLVAALRVVNRAEKPDFILVESSGVADPVEVAMTFLKPEIQPLAPLEGILTVVDAELAPTLEGKMQQLARHQLLAADIAVLNKTDLVDDIGLARAQDWVREVSPRVRLLRSSHGKIPLDLIFDIGGAHEFRSAQKQRGADHLRHNGEADFDTFTFESEAPISAQQLNALLSQLPKTIFRVKGLVNLAEKPDNPCILQSTGRRACLTVEEPWGDRVPRTELVFIGEKGGIQRDWIVNALRSPLEITT